LRNLRSPFLTRQEILLIQPGIDPPLGEKSLVEFADDEFVLRGVA
jgi:hypothetical protein